MQVELWYAANIADCDPLAMRAKVATVDVEAADDLVLLERTFAIDTFNQSGLMTSNRGVVVRFRNGAEFRLTIRQSAEAEATDGEEMA